MCIERKKRLGKEHFIDHGQAWSIEAVRTFICLAIALKTSSSWQIEPTWSTFHKHQHMLDVGTLAHWRHKGWIVQQSKNGYGLWPHNQLWMAPGACRMSWKSKARFHHRHSNWQSTWAHHQLAPPLTCDRVGNRSCESQSKAPRCQHKEAAVECSGIQWMSFICHQLARRDPRVEPVS